NSNAVTHGFFRKYFPEETMEIMEQISERSPLDLLWDQITIQYTAIVRAQRIMYVRDREDQTKVLKREKHTDTSYENEYELQHAWDKQATFLQAQSRAMSTLLNLIRQYKDMSSGLGDEKRILEVQKLEAEVQALNKDAGPEQVVIKDDLHE
ncbi:phage terminase small subunit, partial [Paenibacillus larvae]